MRKPRSRRALLASAMPFALALAGCSERQLNSEEEPSDSELLAADAYDCTDVDRPDPIPPLSDDALEPESYPDSPDSLSDEADQYVLEFERVYRQNAFIEEYGSEAQSFDFRFQARQMDELESDAERDAVLVSIIYNLSATTRQGVESDEWDTRVTYYLDENIVLRARYNGVADSPSFEPDPRSAGGPVACFE